MKKLIPFIFLAVLSGCELNQKDIKPTDEFVKIYNHPNELLSYYPASVIQTSDGGYLILNAIKDPGSESEFPYAEISKTNELGELEWSQTTNHRSPVSKLISLNGIYGFVAMNSNNDGSFHTLDLTTGNIINSTGLLDLKMPLATFVDANGQLIILGYNYNSRTSTIRIFDSALRPVRGSEINVNEDVLTLVQSHLNKTGDQLPFFIGDWDSGAEDGFYINCLSDYSLRVVFFDRAGNRIGGEIGSYEKRDAISSLIHKDESNFAFTRYFGLNNYISPGQEVDLTSGQDFNDLTDNPLYELIPRAKVVSQTISFGETDYMLFASSTNSNSLVVYQYNKEDEEPIKTHYIDFAHNIEVADMIQDEKDNGIIILAKLFLEGKYLRPVLVKVPAREFE